MPPYGTVGLNQHFFSSLPSGSGVGSDVLVNPYITFTAAHTLVHNGEVANRSLSYVGAIPNGTGGSNGTIAVNTFNGTFESTNSRHAKDYVSSSYKYDYAVLRSEEPFPFSYYTDFTIENNYPRTVHVIGYPRDLVGMHKGTATAITDDGTNTCDNGLDLIHYPMNTIIGMSGGPIFNADNTYTTGIHNKSCISSTGIRYGSGIAFDNNILNEIRSWFWAPTGSMAVQYPEPNINVNLVNIQDFDANFSPFNLVTIHGDLEIKNSNVNDSIRWESSINGVLGTGGELDADILKSTLTSGNHRITAIIDSDGESGEKNVNVNIIRPEGEFTSPNHCIKDLANRNTCDFNLSWSVTDTPETSVVLNTTTGNDLATGNSGTRALSATDGNNFNFKLYPSDQKKILLDELDTNDLARKTPTGTLSRNLSVCSLQPTPTDPINLVIRDAKATPPGCGVGLSWGNVKWASPSIYYRKTGQLNWTHLYKIPCALDGSVCNGSMNTDDIIPELVPANGIEFKLLQFNQSDAGQLSAPFSVSAHRYADAYDFDNGFIAGYGMGVGIPTTMAYDHRMSTEAVIGVAQHNHSFHSPASYDPREDIDTIQVCTNNQHPYGMIDCRERFANGKTLEVTVFNMSNGLDVDLAFTCGGIGTDGPIDGQSIVDDFITNQTDPITVDAVTGAKSMKFRIKDHTVAIGSNIACKTNRIVITRTAGTPSENLTYSVVITDPAQSSTPVIQSANAVCNHNYCVQLLGSGFAADASVRVRENLNGSATIATFSGNDIYNNEPLNGQERLQFPIQDVSLQNKFNTNGLCFRVISGPSQSNETCISRPTTAPQGPFMGQTVLSYNSNQDLEHTSYVVVGGGEKLKLLGNSWKKITHNYTVTPDTVLQFDFRSTQQQAEINGIGFIIAGSSAASASRTWQVFGTQSYGNQSHHNYSGDDWVTYRIPIGQTFTGAISDMVFIGDEDNHVGQSVTYRNPILLEQTNADAYDDVPAQRLYDDDVREQSVSWHLADTEHVHNFHDVGDVDWTLIYTSGDRRFRTEAIGNNAGTKMTVYRWISANLHPSGNGTYINVVDQLLGVDDVAGDASFILDDAPLAVYAIKVESRNGASGTGTDYKMIIDRPAATTPDEYDNVPTDRPYDDDTNGQAVSWLAADTEHVHNFHDANDADWTIVYTQGTRYFRTELMGQHADTKISVYHWISVAAHPDGDGRFINVVDQLLGSDDGVGASEFVLNNAALGVYAVKVESRNGNFGAGTEYKLMIDKP